METEIEKRFRMVYDSTTFARIAKTYDTYNKKVVDMGCGYGEYMQRFGKGSVGITTTQSEVDYGKEHNIDIRFGNVEFMSDVLRPGEEFDMFWGNNLFEHLLSPHSFLVHLKPFAKSNALLILGVPVIPKIVSLTKLKKFRGMLASPHINFFTRESLRLTVERAGWKILDTRSFALSSAFLDRISTPLAPHMYIVAQNDPNYKYPPKKIHEWEDDPHFASLLSIMNSKAN